MTGLCCCGRMLFVLISFQGALKLGTGNQLRQRAKVSSQTANAHQICLPRVNMICYSSKSFTPSSMDEKVNRPIPASQLDIWEGCNNVPQWNQFGLPEYSRPTGATGCFSMCLSYRVKNWISFTCVQTFRTTNWFVNCAYFASSCGRVWYTLGYVANSYGRVRSSRLVRVILLRHKSKSCYLCYRYEVQI